MRDWLHAFGLGFELDEESLAGYSQLVTSRLPHQHPIGPFYLARLHGEPVATSALYCEPHVAGLCEVSPSRPPDDKESVPPSPSLPYLTPARWDTASLSCKPREWVSLSTAAWASLLTAPSTPIVGNLALRQFRFS